MLILFSAPDPKTGAGIGQNAQHEKHYITAPEKTPEIGGNLPDFFAEPARRRHYITVSW